MASANLQEIHDTLLLVAFEAGRMILAADPNSAAQDTKANSVDLVTETDKAVEKMVSTRLGEKYPSFLFVGEETYQAGVTKITNEPTFIVDPIDGTTNFVHGFPHACISLGLAIDRKAAVGVVYSPFQDLLFSGIRGQGSYMQRNASLAAGYGQGPRVKLPVVGKGDGSKAPPLEGLEKALVMVEWGSDRGSENYDLKMRTFAKLGGSKENGGSMVHSLRAMGSAALNLCAVAAGQADAYWEGGCYAWDVCAGWCILHEAGGIIAHGNPGDWDPPLDSRVYLAVRGARSGQKELVEEFWKVVGDGKLEYQH